jgi:DNA invertase Pin-like site-specific DNA recombinase
MTDSTTALIYLRAARADDEAIAMQRRACLDHHAAAQGWLVIDVFVDNGVGCLSDRDGFNALCERVKTGQADVVLARDPDRLSRDQEALADSLRLCEDHKVRVIFTSGVILDDWKAWRLAAAPDTARLLKARRQVGGK